MNKTLIIVAGKSGGHVLPGLVIAQQEAANYDHILFFSTQGTLEHSILTNNPSITVTMFNLEPVPYRKPFRFPYWLFQFGRICLQSFKILYRHNPEKIMSMGGLISVPICISAWLLSIPIIIYELNVIPGLANKIISLFSNSVRICFSETEAHFKKKPCVKVEYPLRFTPAIKSQSPDYFNLGLDKNRTTIFVLGGSQGSLFLNQLIKKWIEEISFNELIQVIHQVGQHDKSNWQHFYRKHKIPAFIFTYYDAIEQCYLAADMIICRAGAGTLFESVFFQKPCITIPLECHSTMHQVDNAYTMAKHFPRYVHVLRQNMLTNSLDSLHWILDHFVHAKQARFYTPEHYIKTPTE